MAHQGNSLLSEHVNDSAQVTKQPPGFLCLYWRKCLDSLHYDDAAAHHIGRSSWIAWAQNKGETQTILQGGRMFSWPDCRWWTLRLVLQARQLMGKYRQFCLVKCWNALTKHKHKRVSGPTLPACSLFSLFEPLASLTFVCGRKRLCYHRWEKLPLSLPPKSFCFKKHMERKKDKTVHCVCRQQTCVNCR